MKPDLLGRLKGLAKSLERRNHYVTRQELDNHAETVDDAIRLVLAESEWDGPFPPGAAWIGVDLDGTLAHYDKWKGPEHIGEPIPCMVERVRSWLGAGINLAILTARVSVPEQRDVSEIVIQRWCILHLGMTLPITCRKDYGMIELWDDRAIQVVKNTGERVDSPVERLDLKDHGCVTGDCPHDTNLECFEQILSDYGR